LDVTYHLATEHIPTWDPHKRFQVADVPVPAFKGIVPARDLKRTSWALGLQYGEVLRVEEKRTVKA
jgi:hypothetical protein